MTWVVAIDGPGGSGKSTVSRALARRLGVAHLDTGGYYRAATLAVLRRGVDPGDEPAVVEAVAASRLGQVDGHMLLDGEDVEDEIRGPSVTAAVSEVSAYPEVRAAMVAEQRRWVREHGDKAVVEGRDIGTVVFPEAVLKVYLTADSHERARRRALEKGGDQEAIHRDLARRDAHDSSREASPLTVAEDAVPIDTTPMTVDEVVDEIVRVLGSEF